MNWIKEPNNVYIGRQRHPLESSKWANPHQMGAYNRPQVILLYEEYIHKHKCKVAPIDPNEQTDGLTTTSHHHPAQAPGSKVNPKETIPHQLALIEWYVVLVVTSQ